jgi:hypothetical protein
LRDCSHQLPINHSNWYNAIKAYLSSIIILSLFLSGCGESSSDNTSNPNSHPPPLPGSTWYKPELSSTWQLQLQGAIKTDFDVNIYDSDLFDTPDQTIADLHAAGCKVICYFSGGSNED